MAFFIGACIGSALVMGLIYLLPLRFIKNIPYRICLTVILGIVVTTAIGAFGLAADKSHPEIALSFGQYAPACLAVGALMFVGHSRKRKE